MRAYFISTTTKTPGKLPAVGAGKRKLAPYASVKYEVWRHHLTAGDDGVRAQASRKYSAQQGIFGTGGVSAAKLTKSITGTSKKIHNMSQASKAFLQDIVRDAKREEETVFSHDDDLEYSLAAEDVVKVCEGQIHALALYPGSEPIVVACGDNQGNVALWSPSNDQKSHCHAWWLTDLTRQLYDGTVQKFDMRAMESSVVHRPSSQCRCAADRPASGAGANHEASTTHTAGQHGSSTPESRQVLHVGF
ncbi:hypothetical protein ON010_g16981 [Phytophthora cinnamomi]|nr:hypothetical protein ON010_g16981 [Phytophthora cinnamomi]